MTILCLVQLLLMAADVLCYTHFWILHHFHHFRLSHLKLINRNYCYVFDCFLHLSWQFSEFLMAKQKCKKTDGELVAMLGLFPKFTHWDLHTLANCVLFVSKYLMCGKRRINELRKMLALKERGRNNCETPVETKSPNIMKTGTLPYLSHTSTCAPVSSLCFPLCSLSCWHFQSAQMSFDRISADIWLGWHI